ncbi:MAG: hypothetical protein FRX48_02818 [Lasallia pustulata]|uniref:Peptidase C14 caspase domain-containing protein n=1 Tax=Lasallia pustulata TaxID=136370 RepID=A0A5M8PVM3_9LECA|nr:MAG: hypothetical protein FRX48_02818 [Lasallia pustulata]
MDGVSAVKDHWAVLIGINFYMTPSKSLKGCVRDVRIIEQYLKSTETPVHIDVLTASTPSDTKSCHPTEKPGLWPTYENVTSSLKRITDESKPGDFVYIHYSGHGTRKQSTCSEHSNKDTGDLALVLFHPDGSRYLYGLELACQLKEMVNKGLLVTLVLDCCFSGSVVRHGHRENTGIRTIPYDAATDAAYSQESRTTIGHQVGFDTLRDAHKLPDWLVNPDGYIVIAACGPHETAQELSLDENIRAGALSYFLVRALTSLGRGTQIPIQSLYQHLRIKFHAHWPRQTPMRYGNKKLFFFGKLRLEVGTAFISVFRRQVDNVLCLGAGLAHGVEKDDEYVIYPFNRSEDVSNSTNQAPAKVRVDTVRGLTSDLVETDPTSTTIEVKTGSTARPLTHLRHQKISVQLMASIGDEAQWMATAKRARFLDLSTEDTEGQSSLFNIGRNERNDYIILDESYHKIFNLPTMLHNRKGALDHVVNILEHLATFKYVEGMENRIPKVSFEESFTIYLRDAVGNELEAGGFLDINHGGKMGLTLQNLGEKPLYLAVFDLGPSWQIEDLLSESGDGDFMVVPPKNDEKAHTGKIEISLQMTVPESFRNQDRHQCEDIIKFFITSKSTSFTPLLLPKLSTSTGYLDRPIRGDHNQLSRFLSGLNTSFRGAEDGTSDEEWTTRNFVVRTVA